MIGILYLDINCVYGQNSFVNQLVRVFDELLGRHGTFVGLGDARQFLACLEYGSGQNLFGFLELFLQLINFLVLI